MLFMKLIIYLKFISDNGTKNQLTKNVIEAA